jgi:hypothetical protein
MSLSIKDRSDFGDPQKRCLGPQNDPTSQGPENYGKNCQNEPVGIGGRPPKPIWIILVLYWIYQSPSQLTRVLSLEA